MALLLSMEMEPVACQAVNNRHSTAAVDRDLLYNDTRKCSTTSTSSSTGDLEVTGYRSFPVDDDIFDFTSSNRTSLICDLDFGNSLVDAGTGSLNGHKSVKMHDSPLVGMATCSSMSDKGIPEVPAVQLDKIGKVESHSDDGSEKNFLTGTSKEHRLSYYVRGDDITPDNLSNCSSATSMVGSNDINTHCPVSKNFMPFLRTHEVWKEIGFEGGILEISGCGVSFHVLPSETNCNMDWLNKSPVTQNRSSTRMRLGSDSTKIDRRMVLALDDVPAIVNDRCRIAIGSMVSVEYGNLALLSQGAVLQIEVNAALKEATEQISSRVCKFGCLIASSGLGPYFEVSDDCYYYGNTLQIFISTTDMNKISSDASNDDVATLRMVPIASVQDKHATGTGTEGSVWDGISSMLLWVAVYGPRRSHVCNTCCISVSSATVCPPTISLKKSSKTMLLHLWTAYRVNIQKPQDIQVRLQRDSPDPHITVFPNNIFIEAQDVKSLSRINKLVTVKYTKELKISDDVPSSRTAERTIESCKERTNEKFLLSFLGMESHDMILAVTFVAPIRSPYRSTPVKRWRRNDRVVARPASYCGVATDAQKFLHIWYDSQREAVTKLKPAFVIPGSDREVKFSQYALAITSRLRVKRNKNKPLLLDYYQSDTIPLLTDTTIWMQGTSRFKEWYVGYSRGRIGLIHTRCVKITNHEQCRSESNRNLTVAELIDCLTEPIGDLAFCFSTLKAKLLKRCLDWTLFSSILGFAENYVSRVVREMSNDSTKDIADKFALFLDRFSEFCDSGNRTRKVHQDVIRALLYMEEYSLVVDLLTDFCVWTLSQKLGNALQELQTIFDAPPLENIHVTPNALGLPLYNLGAECKGIHNPAFVWLCEERKRWSGNDEDFLKHLHRAVGQLQKSSIIKWTPYSYALILIYSVPSLCQK